MCLFFGRLQSYSVDTTTYIIGPWTTYKRVPGHQTTLSWPAGERGEENSRAQARYETAVLSVCAVVAGEKHEMPTCLVRLFCATIETQLKWGVFIMRFCNWPNPLMLVTFMAFQMRIQNTVGTCKSWAFLPADIHSLLKAPLSYKRLPKPFHTAS